MTAYEFRSQVTNKLNQRISELKQKLEASENEIYSRRLEGNVGALEWAVREVTIMDVGYVPPSRERRAAISAAIDRQFPPEIAPGKINSATDPYDDCLSPYHPGCKKCLVR